MECVACEWSQFWNNHCCMNFEWDSLLEEPDRRSEMQFSDHYPTHYIPDNHISLVFDITGVVFLQNIGLHTNHLSPSIQPSHIPPSDTSRDTPTPAWLDYLDYDASGSVDLSASSHLWDPHRDDYSIGPLGLFRGDFNLGRLLDECETMHSEASISTRPFAWWSIPLPRSWKDPSAVHTTSVEAPASGVEDSSTSVNQHRTPKIMQAKDNKDDLLPLLTILNRLNAAQFRSLTLFVSPTSLSTSGDVSPDLWIPQISSLIKRAKEEDLSQLKKFTEERGNGDQEQPFPSQLLSAWSLASGIPSRELESTMGLIASLHLLSKLLNSLSIMHLMKLFEVVPDSPPIQQLLLLQQVQQLFAQLQPDTLLNLQSQLSSAPPGTEHDLLLKILSLPSEYFQLYQPLRILLSLDQDELLRLRNVLPGLLPVQMLQLLQLLQLQPFDVLELRNLIVPSEDEEMEDELNRAMPKHAHPPSMPPSDANPDKRLTLQIVEQPPEKSVYKRNLKPNPMVMLAGDQRNNDGNLYIVPRLVRCDTFKEEPKFLTGNLPVRVTPGRVVTFRKLKVTTTSHQQQETLFCVRFELRRYSQAPLNVSPSSSSNNLAALAGGSGSTNALTSSTGSASDMAMDDDGEYEVLDSIFSNPICVLSHSTQMKPIPAVAPTVSEVIPSHGPTTGGTRVAILGANFADSPAARIRFDQIEVMPIFHGGGTLICHTPQHPVGAAQVRVSNASKKYSDDFATFIYEERPGSSSMSFVYSEAMSFVYSEAMSLVYSEAMSLVYSEAMSFVRGGHQGTVGGRGGSTTTRGNASTGRGGLATRGAPISTQPSANRKADLELKEAREKMRRGPEMYGMRMIQWLFTFAVWSGDLQTVTNMMEEEIDLNERDGRGYTPLHYAAANGYVDITELLLDCGCDSDLTDNKGRTALMWSCMEGHDEVTDLLTCHGCNLDSADHEGLTSLTASILFQKVECARILISSGASVFLSGLYQETALHVASAVGSVDVCRMLLEQGAHINAQDEEDETALFWALREGQKEVAQYLIERGIDTDITNVDEEISADYVRYLTHSDVTVKNERKERVNEPTIETKTFEQNFFGRLTVTA
ncbi:hypothetical protein PROFUN_03151 [Planoprotostelium fungivorum]|uniref:IPT/TIG domain-containing protein n=1 Tax=Planoprotostelium fungivorum TaxID=1890364 RepID=A0A2P6NWU3_9EUKA|nr:hypothetical protein PROFUN_03151 [Planoprotostelium fungivorum]